LLVYDNQVLQSISFWRPLVPIGIIATTFSGELSALIGSSRVLKALADDQLFGPVLNFVKYGKTKSGNPWVAVIITFIFAEVIYFFYLISFLSRQFFIYLFVNIALVLTVSSS
jgi:potassium/chloride transporter 9